MNDQYLEFAKSGTDVGLMSVSAGLKRALVETRTDTEWLTDEERQAIDKFARRAETYSHMYVDDLLDEGFE